MTQYQVAHVDGAYRVYSTETGIDRTYFDQTFRKPRAAIEYSDELAGLPGRHRSPDLARDRISTASRDEVAVPIEAPDDALRARRQPVPLQASRQRRPGPHRAAATAAGQRAPEPPGTDTDGGPRLEPAAAGPPGPSDAVHSLGARAHPSPAGPPTGQASLDL